MKKRTRYLLAISEPARERPGILLNGLASLSTLVLLMAAPLCFSADVVQPKNLDAISELLLPGEWYLLKHPAKEVLPRRSQQTETIWGRTGSGAVIESWNGASFDSEKMDWYFHGGGHNDYGGNGVYRFNFNTLSWSKLTDPYILPPRDKDTPCPQPSEEGHGPQSAHTYDKMLWSHVTRSIWYWNGSGYCIEGYAQNVKAALWTFMPEEARWRRYSYVPVPAERVMTAELPDGTIALVNKKGAYHFNPANRSILKFGNGLDSGHGQMIYVKEKNEFYINGWSQFYVVDGSTFSVKKSELRSLDSRVTPMDGMAYHPSTGRIIFWNGNRQIASYDVVRAEWQVLLRTHVDSAPTGSRPLSKWIYLKEHDMFAGVASHKDGVWFYRLPERPVWESLPEKSVEVQVGEAAGKLVALHPDKYRYGVLLKRNGTIFDGGGSEISGVLKRKGVIIVDADDVTIRNVTLRVGDESASNYACIRIQGRNTTLENVKCIDSQMGILTGGHIGNLRILNSVFLRSGTNPGGNLGHMIYACSNGNCDTDDSLEVKNSEFRDIGLNRAGHGVKSRAPVNVILDNQFVDGEGRAGRMIDLPQGGESVIRGNVFERGASAENDDFIGIFHERDNARFQGWGGRIRIEGNTFLCPESVFRVCKLVSGKFRSGDEVVLKDNLLDGDFSQPSIVYRTPETFDE